MRERRAAAAEGVVAVRNPRRFVVVVVVVVDVDCDSGGGGDVKSCRGSCMVEGRHHG